MIKLTIANLVEVFRLSLALLLARFSYKKGKADEQNKALKDTVARLSNRPRSDDDVIKRLHEWQKRANKRER